MNVKVEGREIKKVDRQRRAPTLFLFFFGDALVPNTSLHHPQLSSFFTFCE